MRRQAVGRRRRHCGGVTQRLCAACWLAAIWLFAASVNQAAGSAAAQSVAYQLNPAHDGHMPNAALATPLAEAWAVTLPGPSSYPLIVNGMVFVVADKTLYARNQATGAAVWAHELGGSFGRAAALAYDRGQVFAAGLEGDLTAFDPATGAVNWRIELPYQSMVTAPPTAANGIIYVAGWDQGTLFAVRESSGRILWSRSVGQGGSAAAVDAQAVYANYVCEHAYAFSRTSGEPLWQHAGVCTGGGGRTPVIAGGMVFARESTVGDDLIYSASTGAVLGTFRADPAPAFAGGDAFILSLWRLARVAAFGQGATAWEFAGDGNLTSAPLIVGNLVFAGSSSGALYALDRTTGTTSWSTNVGSAIPEPDEAGISAPLTAMAASNGTLVVPAGNRIIAYRTAGTTAAPVNLVAPAIDGVANPGERLAADVGVWSGLPSHYSYQWQLCNGGGSGCTDVGGATAASFFPTAAHIGATLRVRIVASNAVAAGAAVTSSPAAIVGAAPVNETAPAISGTAHVGRKLTTDLGTWLGDPASYTIRWVRCYDDGEQACSEIPGATASTYTIQPADNNREILLRVIAANAFGSSEPIDSARTAGVTYGPPTPPGNLSPPTFAGIPDEHELLTAAPGAWSGNPSSYRYQWFSCDIDIVTCADITGATQQTYVVTASQIGRLIGVEVIATNGLGDSDPAPSDIDGPVLMSYPRNVSSPSVSGRPQDGETLTADHGSWTSSPTSYSHQWYACNAAVTICERVPGATATRYHLSQRDVGQRYGVGVIAANARGASDEEFSDLTDSVRPATTTPPPAPPVVGAPAARPDSTFTIVSLRALPSGTIAINVRPSGPGRFSARATAAAASLARGCLTRCKRTGRALFGTGSARANAPGIVTLVVKPSLRASRALKKRPAMRVRVQVTFRSALGGTPTMAARSLTVKRTIALPRHVSSARARRMLSQLGQTPPALGQLPATLVTRPHAPVRLSPARVLAAVRGRQRRLARRE